MRKPISWEELWMEMAVLVSKRSKDPNTQVGCILVSPDQRRIALGYNGFAAGIEETEELWKRPTKYDYVIHAEENAIINRGVESVNGWTAFITMPPCHHCTSKLIQAGISRVVWLNEASSNAFNYDLSFKLLKEAGIQFGKLGTQEENIPYAAIIEANRQANEELNKIRRSNA